MKSGIQLEIQQGELVKVAAVSATAIKVSDLIGGFQHDSSNDPYFDGDGLSDLIDKQDELIEKFNKVFKVMSE